MTASFVDAIYFSMVTLTTVGYGDMGPSTPGTRLFTCFFAMFGVGVAGLSLGVFIDEIRKFRARTQAARHQIDYAYTLRTPTVQCSAYEAFVCRIGMHNYHMCHSHSIRSSYHFTGRFAELGLPACSDPFDQHAEVPYPSRP